MLEIYQNVLLLENVLQVDYCQLSSFLFIVNVSKDYILDIDDTDIENRKSRFHIDIYISSSNKYALQHLITIQAFFNSRFCSNVSQQMKKFQYLCIIFVQMSQRHYRYINI